MSQAMARVWALAFLTVGGCGGGDSARQCTFNSDCPTGRYCTAAGSCTADCTSDSECVTMLGAGAACSSFGMCVATPDAGALPDAGGRDAGTPMDGGARDAGPGDAGSDAGPPAEVCTPSMTGSVPTDEDGDGEIDEGCPWHFGRPHAVLSMAWAVVDGRAGCFGSFVDETGLKLYVACSGGAPAAVMFASRPSRAEPFARPVAVAFSDATIVPYEIALERGGLRGILQAALPGMGADLFLASRTAPGSPFTLRRLDVLSDAAVSELHPALSGDGLELFFGRGQDVYRALRASVADDFGAPAVVPGLQGNGLSLSDDGHDLFFYAVPAGRRNTIFRAHRADVATAVFDTPEEVVELNPTGADDVAFPHVSLATRELFFSTGGRGWAPTSGRATYRVQVCRDGPCDEPLVDCPASGRRSPDGFHCYFAGPTPMETWDGAVAGCGSRGAHLATVHSEAERALLWSSFSGAATALWLGATDATTEGTWRWDWPGRVVAEDPEEPSIFQLWGTSEPNGRAVENCLMLYRPETPMPGLFNDAPCVGSWPYVCEDDTWPTW